MILDQTELPEHHMERELRDLEEETEVTDLVTPTSLIAAIVTEQGISRPPYPESLEAAVRAAESERIGR